MRVAGHHHGRVPAQPRQQHLELGVGTVLGLIDHDEGVVERAPAHVADRGDLDQALGHQVPDPLHRQAIRQGVVEGTQIGGQFVFHGPGQETDGFPGLDGGAGQDDAADLAGLQRLDRLGHRQIGLAGAGRTQGHDQALGINGVQQLGLAVRLGLDGLEVGLVAGLVIGP